MKPTSALDALVRNSQLSQEQATSPESFSYGLQDMVADIEIRKAQELERESLGLPFGKTSAYQLMDKDLPTSLETTYRQDTAEIRAVSEYNRLRGLAVAQGKEDQLQEYIEKGGKVGVISGLDYEGERTLDTIFDTLSAGNYATAGFVDELLRSGSALKAFRRAAIEFGDAMPAIDFDEAKKETWDDVFANNGVDFYGKSVAAFALDVLLDPVNLIPGAAVAKGLGKAGQAGIKAAGPLGESFNRIFRPQALFKDKFGDVGEAFLRSKDYAEAGINKEYHKLAGKIDRATANMTPSERLLFGLWMDQPEKLKAEMERMVNSGFMDASRLDELDKTIEGINQINKLEFRRERKWGMFDDLVMKDNYVHGMEAVDPSLKGSFADHLRNRGSSNLPKAGQKAPYQQQRTTANQEERFRLILEGKLKAESTELDIANILHKRAFDHVRFINSRKFAKGVLDTDAVFINSRNRGLETRFSTRVPENIVDTPNDYRKFKEELKDDQPGMALFEIKRQAKRIVKDKKGNPKLDDKGNEIIETYDKIDSAYVLPQEVVDHLVKADSAFGGADELTSFWRNVEKITAPWRGWATLSPGFHMRNYLGMLGTNWIRGVGAKEVDASRFSLGAEGTNKFRIPTGTGFILRHLQAAQVQVAIDGAGSLPAWMAKGLNESAQSLGYKDFTEIPLPKITVDGKQLSADDIGRLAQDYDVPQSIGHMGPTGENINKFIWKDVDPEIDLARLADSEVSDITQEALKIAASKKRTAGQVANRYLGTDNPLIKFNRAAATIPENNGRLALFIDRLAKGDTADIAALDTKKWHFDYRKLSPVEKEIFSAFLPFYAWSRFALPRMFMAMVEDPGRMSKIPKLQRAIEDFKEDSGYPEYETPDYYDEIQAVQLPFMDNDGYPVYATLDMPWMELNRLNSKDFLASINPVGKVFFESATGQNFFTGTPTERFRGEEVKGVNWLPFTDDTELALPVDKTTRQVVGNLMPPVERYLFRLQELADRDLGKYAAVREMGVNVRPLDVRRVLRGKNFERVKLAREFFQRQAQLED